MLYIGSAQADITPGQPMVMGGSFLKFESSEVLDPIMAGCIVAGDGKTLIACISCDLGTVTGDLALAIRARAAEATGIPAGNIHLLTTHNHSGPTTRSAHDAPLADDDEASLARREALRQKLAADIAACAAAARARLVPARLGHGRGHFAGGAFNRRFIMSNGRSRMHGGGGLERLRAEGPVDREVQAAWFEDTGGRPLAVLVNYASHPTNLYGKPTVSADFPGAMRQGIQAVLGQSVPVLYLQGACGNIMCRDLENPHQPAGLDNARRIGRGLAGETLRIMSDHSARDCAGGIGVAGRTITIPYRAEPPMPFEAASEKWAYYRDHWDEFRALDIEERAMINSTLRLAGNRRLAPGEPAEIAAFAIGDVYFVGNPAELFVEFQLDIKARFEGRRVIVTELTNGWIGYVPTRLACALGGYETIQTRFNPGTGELIRDESIAQLEKLLK